MADIAAVAFDVRTREGTAPDDVVPGVEGNFDLEAVALGVVLDHGGAFPGGLGAAVVLHHHEGAVVQHAGPFRHEYRIEGNLLSDLVASYDDEEIGDGRVVQPQFRFRSGGEVFHGSAFDPDFASAAEPGVELPVGLEGAEHQRLEIVLLGGAGAHDDVAAALSPVRVFPPEHLQGLVFGVGVAVDHPDGPALGRLFVHEDFFQGSVLLPNPADVSDGVVARVEGDHGLAGRTERFRERPIDLHVRGRQGSQEPVGIQAARSVLAPHFGRQEVPEGLRIGFHPRAGFRSHPGSGCLEQVLHRVFRVVSVVGRSRNGIAHFPQLRLPERDGGQEAGHLLQGEQGFSVLHVDGTVVVQPLAGGRQEGAAKAPQQHRSLHVFLYRVSGPVP